MKEYKDFKRLHNFIQTTFYEDASVSSLIPQLPLKTNETGNKVLIDELIRQLDHYINSLLLIQQIAKLVYVKTFLSEGLVESLPTSKNETPYQESHNTINRSFLGRDSFKDSFLNEDEYKNGKKQKNYAPGTFEDEDDDEEESPFKKVIKR